MENGNFTTNGKIWLEVNNVKVIGPGRVELLERIQVTGSISQAALQMAMSYRKAWQIIRDINAHFNSPVVISHRGGKGGGNAELTETGKSVVLDYKSLQHKFHQFLADNKVNNRNLQP